MATDEISGVATEGKAFFIMAAYLGKGVVGGGGLPDLPIAGLGCAGQPAGTWAGLAG